MLNNYTDSRNHVNNWHIDLRKRHEYLSKIMVAIGWEYDPGNTFDLDLICFLLGENHKLISKDHFVFYNNLRSPDGAVEHSGDNNDGRGDGADEIIYVNLDLIDQNVQEMIFSVIINKAEDRDQVFGLLADAFVTIEDVEHDRQLISFQLDTEFPSATSEDLARLVKQGEHWEFQNHGICTDNDLPDYLRVYGQPGN